MKTLLSLQRLDIIVEIGDRASVSSKAARENSRPR